MNGTLHLKQNGDPPGGINRIQSAGLLILRVFIGWHFLYEGVVKWSDPDWSSTVFLEQSTWIFSGFFKWLAAGESVLSLIDFLNPAGLILIGVALIAGLLTRPAALCGIVILGLYYLAHPPLFGGTVSAIAGRYLLIDMNLIEMAGLYLLFAFNAGHIAGLDALTWEWRSQSGK